MASLVAAAKSSDTDALVVLYRGQEVINRWFHPDPGPIESMSITKSVTSLAIGRLRETGALATVDVPLYKFFSEWRQGTKRQITLRHVLEMRSGLQDLPMTGREIDPSPDVVQLALCAELDHAPGAFWMYSNKAANLVPRVVQHVAGIPTDQFIRKEIFEPLGVGQTTWKRDPAGNLYGMSGLSIWPDDVARIGQLMLQRGRWAGEQLLDPAWVDEALQGSAVAAWYGQLWWVDLTITRVFDDETFRAWAKAGVPKTLRRALEPLRNRTITGPQAIEDALANVGGLETFRTKVAAPSRHWGRVVRTLTSVRADGWQGQRLLLFNDLELVVVRMRRSKFGNTSQENREYGFEALPQLSRALIKHSPTAGAVVRSAL